MSYRVIETREVMFEADSVEDAADKATRTRSWETTFLAVDTLDEDTLVVDRKVYTP